MRFSEYEMNKNRSRNGQKVMISTEEGIKRVDFALPPPGFTVDGVGEPGYMLLGRLWIVDTNLADIPIDIRVRQRNGAFGTFSLCVDTSGDLLHFVRESGTVSTAYVAKDTSSSNIPFFNVWVTLISPYDRINYDVFGSDSGRSWQHVGEFCKALPSSAYEAYEWS